jgi:hypothetical protein
LRFGGHGNLDHFDYRRTEQRPIRKPGPAAKKFWAAMWHMRTSRPTHY